MKNYSATNTIILIGKVIYILLYVIGGIILILGLTGYGFDGAFQTYLGLAMLLLGFLFMFSTELLSIFRDTAVNTYNTYNLLKLSTKGMVTSDKDKITKEEEEEEELMKKKDEERKEMMRKEEKFMKKVIPLLFGVIIVILVIVYFTR